MECTENADGEEECVPKKKVKKVNVEEKFLTTYYEFPNCYPTLEALNSFYKSLLVYQRSMMKR